MRVPHGNGLIAPLTACGLWKDKSTGEGWQARMDEVVDGKTVVKEVEVEAEPSAADLGNFGTREWITAVLVDYKNHFAPLKNAPGVCGGATTTSNIRWKKWAVTVVSTCTIPRAG